MYYVYIAECADGTLYTGMTKDPEARIKAHNSGKGAKYTRSRLPVKLVYSERFEEKGQALSREYYIKHHLSREEKKRLTAGPSAEEKKGPAAGASEKKNKQTAKT